MIMQPTGIYCKQKAFTTGNCNHKSVFATGKQVRPLLCNKTDYFATSNKTSQLPFKATGLFNVIILTKMYSKICSWL